jgi:hypothetical protein
MRRRVVQELLETERDYVRDMAFTVQAYLLPLRGTPEKPYPILPVAQVGLWFVVCRGFVRFSGCLCVMLLSYFMHLFCVHG